MNATGYRLSIPRTLTALRELCATEKTRYALDAVHVERRAGVARVTVTEGHYLARAEWDSPGWGGDFSVLVPADAFKGGRGRGPLVLEILGDKCQLNGTPLTLAEGDFPPSDDVMVPASRVDAVAVKLDTLQLLRVSEALNAHDRAARVCVDAGDDADAKGALVLEFSLGKLVLRGNGRARLSFPDLQVKHVELECKGAVTTGLNPRYLHKLATALRDAAGVTGLITLGIADGHAAIRVSAVEGQRNGVRYAGLLMPVSVGS